MSWVSYKNTQAVGKKLKNDLDIIGSIINLVIQILFIMYYTFMSISKLSSPVRHYIYSSFLIVAVIYLIFHIVSKDKVHKDTKNKIKKIIRYIKYPIRVGLITFAIVDIIINGGSDADKLATIFSVVAFFTQIIVQLTLRFTRRYTDLITEAAKMDYEESELIKAVVNSNLYPQPQERLKISSAATTMIKNGVNDFIANNANTAPIKELTDKQIELREDIEDIKTVYATVTDKKAVTYMSYVESLKRKQQRTKKKAANAAAMIKSKIVK